MTLNEATLHIQKLQTESGGKSESSIYDRLLGIVINLSNRKFSKEEKMALESELEGLRYPELIQSKKKYYRKYYNRLTSFLRKEFDLVTPNHYTNMYMVFGMTFGSGIGMASGTALKGGPGTAIGMSLGTGVGMVIGMSIGAAKDAEAKKQNKVLS